MTEQLESPAQSDDPFAHAKELAQQLDPVVEIAQDMPEKPGLDAKSKEKYAYKRDEKRLVTAAPEMYPEDLEGAMVMTGLTTFLRQQSAMDHPEVSHSEKLAKTRQLTEYQFLMTHFVLQRSDDEDYMRQFWESAETLAEKAGKGADSIKRLQVGILSTVASMKALESLGYQPELAHPEQDAYDAIDMWNGDHQALQIKGSSGHHSQLEVYRTDTVEFPAVRLDDEGKPVKMISTGSTGRLERDLAKFATKVDNVAAREGRDVEGLFIRIPYSRINNVTGEPSPELLEELRHKLEQHEAAEEIS